MSRSYEIGDTVLASDLGLSVDGELVQLIDGKTINPVGWCFLWAEENGKPGLWMPTKSIIRHATPEEVISFAGNRREIIQREIAIHRKAIEVLETQLLKVN